MPTSPQAETLRRLLTRAGYPPQEAGKINEFARLAGVTPNHLYLCLGTGRELPEEVEGRVVRALAGVGMEGER